MATAAVRWLLLIVAVGVALVGLSVASGAFDRAMDEDIGTLSSYLKDGGAEPKQVEALTAAFRSTQYNVRNLVANICYTLTAALSVAWVAAIVVPGIGHVLHCKGKGNDT